MTGDQISAYPGLHSKSVQVKCPGLSTTGFDSHVISSQTWRHVKQI